MDALSQSRPRVLHKGIVEHFNKISVEKAEKASLPKRSCYQRFVAGIRGVFRVPIVCGTARSDARRNMLSALPAELVAECFRLLDLKDCIAVSHVSRVWRLAALADRGLWNYHYIRPNCRSIHTAVDALEALLARSHPVPFRFICDLTADDIPCSVYVLVARNLDRMAVLKLDDGSFISTLFALDAPLLSRLTCHSLQGQADRLHAIPAHWGALSAPRLENLKLWGFSLPPDCQPFMALRALDLFLPPGGIASISFSHIFPNLTYLKLRGVTQDSLPMLSPLPRGVEIVQLGADSAAEGAIDYSHFLSSLPEPCKIRNLQFYCATSFLDALGHFVRIYDGLWKMEVCHTAIRMRRSDGDVLWVVGCYSAISLRRELRFSAHLQRLAELELPLASFVELHCIPGTNARERSLPSLRALLLDVDISSALPIPVLLRADEHDGISRGAIAMPALELVTLRLWGYPIADSGVLRRWLVCDAPVLLPRLLYNCNSPRLLASIYIRTRHSESLSHQDVAPLLQVVERVSVGTGSNPEEAGLVFAR